MREKLNSSPAAQIALIGILVLGVGFFLLKSTGGGEESEAAPVAEPAVTEVGSELSPSGSAAALTDAPAATASTIPAPPLPAPVLHAYDSDETVVLLVVRGGGVDDRFVAQSVQGLASQENVAVFVTRAKHIARYAAITLGVNVERVPALIVVRPRGLSHGALQAEVSYGYQSSQSVIQAVRDASYHGPEPAYHPG